MSREVPFTAALFAIAAAAVAFVAALYLHAAPARITALAVFAAAGIAAAHLLRDQSEEDNR